MVSVSLYTLPGVYLLCDMALVSGIPVRLAHVYQPMAFLILYAVFALVYWAAGGTGETGQQPYIHPVLDYGHSPGRAAGWTFEAVFMGAPALHVLVFVVYKVRGACCGCCCGLGGRQHGSRERDTLLTP